MATRTSCAPHSVGTGQEAEKEEGQNLERPSSSSARPDREESVCLVCALGTKGSHTYQRECKRYVAGATLEGAEATIASFWNWHYKGKMQSKRGSRSKKERGPLEGKLHRHQAARVERQALHHGDRQEKGKEISDHRYRGSQSHSKKRKGPCR